MRITTSVSTTYFDQTNLKDRNQSNHFLREARRWERRRHKGYSRIETRWDTYFSLCHILIPLFYSFSNLFVIDCVLCTRLFFQANHQIKMVISKKKNFTQYHSSYVFLLLLNIKTSSIFDKILHMKIIRLYIIWSKNIGVTSGLPVTWLTNTNRYAYLRCDNKKIRQETPYTRNIFDASKYAQISQKGGRFIILRSNLDSSHNRFANRRNSQNEYAQLDVCERWISVIKICALLMLVNQLQVIPIGCYRRSLVSQSKLITRLLPKDSQCIPVHMPRQALAVFIISSLNNI